MSSTPRARKTLSEDVFGATLWNTLLLPVRIAVSLLTSVVYYGVLSRAQIGLLFFLQNLANTLGTYVDLGIERTVPRFLPEVAEREGKTGVRRVLQLILRTRLFVLVPVVAALLAAAAPLASHLATRQRAQAKGATERAAALTPALAAEGGALREQAAADHALADLLERRGGFLMLAVAALVVIGAFHDVLMQVLAAFFKRRAWNAITLAGNLLQPLLVTTLVLWGLGVPGVLAGFVVAPLVCLALSFRAGRRTLRELHEGPFAAPSPAPDGAASGDTPLAVKSADAGFGSRFARFAAFTWLIALTTWLYDLPFLVLFAAQRLPLDQVALLGFAYKYAKDFAIYAFWPLVGLVQPVLARIRARDSAVALRDAYLSLVRIAWLILMPAGVGLVVLSPRLIATLYPRYAEGAALATLFVAFVFAEALLHVALLVMMTAERYRAILLSRLLGLLSLPALLWLMPRYGMPGAAVAVGVVRLLPALFASLYASRHMGLPLPLRFGGRVALACVAFAGPLYLLLGSGPGPGFDPRQPAQVAGLLPLFGLVLVGAVVFVFALRATGGLEPDDRRRLLALNLPGKAFVSRLL